MMIIWKRFPHYWPFMMRIHPPPARPAMIMLPFSVPKNTPDNKVHGANMGPTWVLSAPDGPHDGPMILAIWDIFPMPEICHGNHEVHQKIMFLNLFVGTNEDLTFFVHK